MSRYGARTALGMAATALAACAAHGEDAGTGTGGSVRFYGQISPAWIGFDDGVETTGAFADNDNAVSRLGFVLTRPAGEGTLTLTVETAPGVTKTSQISQNAGRGPIDWGSTDLRKAEVAYAGAFGTLTFGQGSMATDTIAKLDRSGTAVAGSVSVPDTAGAFFFRRTDGTVSDIDIGNAFSDLDGSRLFRMRYDTPAVSGITLAVAYGRDVVRGDGQTEQADLGLRWSGKVGGLAFAAAAGYAWTGLAEGDGGTRVSGSATVSHAASGLSLSVSAGSKRDGGRYGYVKAGWTGSLLDVGPTALSADWYAGRDFAAAGSTSRAVGVSAVQSFDAAADLQVYAGWRRYEYADDAADYRPARSVLFGLLWRF